jgi:carbonic anhydrase/acetyltransferase-like protein (isoleucine patch superfamily)
MKPEIEKTTFIAKTSVIIGNVKIGKKCGIYPKAVIRGDQNSIEIDDGSNVQDCCVIHCDKNHNVKIGKNVSIGHSAIVHGAKIENNCLIGMNATILNGAEIGMGSIIGACALIKENMIIPKFSLVIGIPGKIKKNDEKFMEIAKKNAITYQNISQKHLKGLYHAYEDFY